MGEPISIKERIRRAQPTTRTVRVWLGADLDLVDEYEAARAVLDGEVKPGDSLAAGKQVREAQQRVDELRAQLDEFAVDFRLRGLDDFHYARLIAQHPPRTGDDGTVVEQDRSGWNADTFPPALVRMCTVEPQLDDEDWRALLGDEDTLGVLTSRQLDGLATVAFQLTRHPVDVPFSPAASTPTRNSGRA